MSRKRLLELTATAALLLLIAGMLACWLYYQRLNDAVAAEISHRGPVARIHHLLRKGASIHTRDKTGATVLMVAARETDLPLMRRALAAGVDVNARTSDGATALMFCAHSPKSVRLLLAAGADVNAKNATGKTPLMCAVSLGWPRHVMKILLDHGADANARDSKGRTALAFTTGYPATLRLLKRHRAKE